MAMRSLIVAIAGLSAIFVFTPAEAIAQGCAMCKTAVGGPGDPLSSGINTSILFMMAMPFVLFTAVGGWLGYMFWSNGQQAATRPDLDLLRAEREASR